MDKSITVQRANLLLAFGRGLDGRLRVLPSIALVILLQRLRNRHLDRHQRHHLTAAHLLQVEKAIHIAHRAARRDALLLVAPFEDAAVAPVRHVVLGLVLDGIETVHQLHQMRLRPAVVRRHRVVRREEGPVVQGADRPLKTDLHGSKLVFPSSSRHSQQKSQRTLKLSMSCRLPYRSSGVIWTTPLVKKSCITSGTDNRCGRTGSDSDAVSNSEVS